MSVVYALSITSPLEPEANVELCVKNDKLDPYAKIVAEKSTTNIKAIANDFRIFLNSSLFM